MDVTRPGQTGSEGLKVPVIYASSPYFAGTARSFAFWDVKQEVGAESPPRGPMSGPPFQAGRTRISNSLVNTWVSRGFSMAHSEARRSRHLRRGASRRERGVSRPSRRGWSRSSRQTGAPVSTCWSAWRPPRMGGRTSSTVWSSRSVSTDGSNLNSPPRVARNYFIAITCSTN